MRPIGYTTPDNIDEMHRTAEFHLLIGEKDCWGKGYGTEATCLMLDYGFNALGLHNGLLMVMADNERGIRAYTATGFRLIGVRRQALRFAGRTYDHIYMDCLADEFESPVLWKLLTEW